MGGGPAPATGTSFDRNILLCYLLRVPTNSRKSRGTFGLYARNFPASVKSRVDFDYREKLTDEDRLWLAQFADNYYGADFRGNPGDWSTTDKRRAYVAKNCANSDLFGAIEANRTDDLQDHPGLASSDEQDLSDEPAYLRSPEYKAALAAYRALLDPGRKPVSPKNSPALRRALERLRRIVNAQEN